MNHPPKLSPSHLPLKLRSAFGLGKVAVAGACCFLAIQTFALSEIINDVDFSYVYRGTAAPTNPPWTTPLANGKGESNGSIFTIETTASENRYYLLTAGGTNPWDATATSGTTVEFSTRVVSQAAGASMGAVNLTLTNGSLNFSFILGAGTIGINGDSQTSYTLDTSVFRTYRLTLSGDGPNATMSVYVDGNETPVISSYASTASNSANRLYFGDPSTTYGGKTEWQYIAFTNQGAYAPTAVPEPATVALLSFGLAGLIYRHRTLLKK